MRLDLTGERFERLTVVGPSDRKLNGSRGRVWECVCDCGTVTYATTSQLTLGERKSCGCSRGPRTQREHEPFIDCMAYRPGRRDCRGLVELLCATEGHCSFYKKKE